MDDFRNLLGLIGPMTMAAIVADIESGIEDSDSSRDIQTANRLVELVRGELVANVGERRAKQMVREAY